MSSTKLFHHYGSGPAGLLFMVYMVLFMVISTLLLANTTQAMDLGTCHYDFFCSGDILSTPAGDPKPNNEVIINGTCYGFRSLTAEKYKADICTKSKCERLRYGVCFDGGPWKSIEFVE